jgi:tripartite-type tricarboxylate transporter receptor subunit TctC
MDLGALQPYRWFIALGSETMSASNIITDPDPSLPSRRALLVAAAALGALGLAGCGQKLRKVQLINGAADSSTSGGLARIVARHLPRFGVEAEVRSIAEGGGKRAARALAEARGDGKTIGLLPTALIYTQLLREKDFTTDLLDFQWLGSCARDRRVLAVTRQSGVDSFAELVGRPTPLLMPSGSGMGASRHEALIIRHLTGAPLEIATGLTAGARFLSLASGKTQGILGSLDALGPVFEMAGSKVILRLNDEALPQDIPLGLGGAPLLADVAHGADEVPLVELITTHARLGRIFALPPGTPIEEVTSWQATLAALIADPAFRQSAGAAGLEIRYSDGATVTAELRSVLGPRRAAIEAALRRAIADSPEPA